MIEVVLAKPVDKNDYVRYTRGSVGGRTGSFSQMVHTTVLSSILFIFVLLHKQPIIWCHFCST